MTPGPETFDGDIPLKLVRISAREWKDSRSFVQREIGAMKNGKILACDFFLDEEVFGGFCLFRGASIVDLILLLIGTFCFSHSSSFVDLFAIKVVSEPHSPANTRRFATVSIHPIRTEELPLVDALDALDALGCEIEMLPRKNHPHPTTSSAGDRVHGKVSKAKSAWHGQLVALRNRKECKVALDRLIGSYLARQPQ